MTMPPLSTTAPLSTAAAGAAQRTAAGDRPTAGATDLFAALVAALLVPGPPVPLQDNAQASGSEEPPLAPAALPGPLATAAAAAGLVTELPEPLAGPDVGQDPEAAQQLPPVVPEAPAPVGAARAPEGAVSVDGVAAEVIAAPADGADAAHVAERPLPEQGEPATPALAGTAETVLVPAARVAAPDEVAPATAAAPVERPAPAQVATALGPVLKRPDGTYRVTMHLEPEALGRVAVTVELRDGRVDLHLHAAQTATGELLRSSLDELRQELADQGFEGGSLDVSAGGTGPQADQHAASDRRPASAPAAPAADLTDPSAVPDPGVAARGLDVSL